jgi:hypothetical protein
MVAIVEIKERDGKSGRPEDGKTGSPEDRSPEVGKTGRVKAEDQK